MSRKKTPRKTSQRRLDPLQGMESLFLDATKFPSPAPTPSTANAKQVGGDHYKTDRIMIEPWDYCLANQLDPMQFAIIKYVTRWPDKGGIQDLEKIVHYLEKYIESLRNGMPHWANPDEDQAKYKEYLIQTILKG